MFNIRLLCAFFVAMTFVTEITSMEQDNLLQAVSSGNVHTVKVLLQRGIERDVQDAEGNTPLHQAIFLFEKMPEEAYAILEELVNKANTTFLDRQNHKEETALYSAVERNLLYATQKLLQAGANRHIITEYKSLLYVATKQGLIEIVQLLLGADIDINQRTFLGNTALLGALKHLNALKYTDRQQVMYYSAKLHTVIQLLLNNKADVTLEDSVGLTPLHIVVQTHNPELVEELIKRGSHLNAQSIMGNTPLHHAISNSEIFMVKILITCGASLTIKNKKGETPLDSAKKLLQESRDEATIQGLEESYHRACLQKIIELLEQSSNQCTWSTCPQKQLMAILASFAVTGIYWLFTSFHSYK
jgi:uncharacterized protein